MFDFFSFVNDQPFTYWTSEQLSFRQFLTIKFSIEKNQQKNCPTNAKKMSLQRILVRHQIVPLILSIFILIIINDPIKFITFINCDHQTLNHPQTNSEYESLMASQHYQRIIKYAKCQRPHARVVNVQSELKHNPSASKKYIPHCTILHTCGPHSGCCRLENEQCIPKRIEDVKLYFWTIELTPRGHKKGIEVITMQNHTECMCAPIGTINKLNNNNDNSDSKRNPRKLWPLSTTSTTTTTTTTAPFTSSTTSSSIPIPFTKMVSSSTTEKSTTESAVLSTSLARISIISDDDENIPAIITTQATIENFTEQTNLLIQSDSLIRNPVNSAGGNLT